MPLNFNLSSLTTKNMIITHKINEVEFTLTNETPCELVKCLTCNFIAPQEKFFKADDPEDEDYCIDLCPSCGEEGSTEWFVSEDEIEVSTETNFVENFKQNPTVLQSFQKLRRRFPVTEKVLVIVK